MTIVELQSEAEFREAFTVMHELRTHLDEGAYMSLVQDMRKRGYRLFALRNDEGTIVALAGIEFSVNFYYGRHIWVFDLVTSQNVRSQGHGRTLLAHLETLGKEAGCDTIALSSGFQRIDAHRFYEAHMGYERQAYTFVKNLKT
jgi:GNAT superfamily N-acetyltransferase